MMQTQPVIRMGNLEPPPDVAPPKPKPVEPKPAEPKPQEPPKPPK